ncbi:MAG TPA: LysR substrate-binding domain-containing protein [Kineosporiaceae bacterium]|nr:LysR substrate-binding domain-containing protein [Kineosporiaceae bacterium]
MDAVAAGLGWGMLPRVQAAPLLGDGRLVELDPTGPVDVLLFWQQWRLDSPALAATADAVVAAAAEHLGPMPQGRAGSGHGSGPSRD